MERLIKTANTELTMSGQRQEMKRKSSTRSGEKDDERMDEEEAEDWMWTQWLKHSPPQ